MLVPPYKLKLLSKSDLKFFPRLIGHGIVPIAGDLSCSLAIPLFLYGPKH
jgi:hypothetical protein